MNNGVHFVQDLSQIPKDSVLLQTGPSLDKLSLLAALAASCAFPVYFGGNWDAAWDALADSTVDNLVLDMRVVSSINKPHFDIFINMMADAYDEYGRPQIWIVEA